MSVTVRFEVIFDDAEEANNFVQGWNGIFQVPSNDEGATLAEEYARRIARTNEQNRALLDYFEERLKAKRGLTPRS